MTISIDLRLPLISKLRVEDAELVQQDNERNNGPLMLMELVNVGKSVKLVNDTKKGSSEAKPNKGQINIGSTKRVKLGKISNWVQKAEKVMVSVREVINNMVSTIDMVMGNQEFEEDVSLEYWSRRDGMEVMQF
ncbi:hypothetical protein GOBAR_AA11172 [Gossypium barbadense]|uniref:Uncharacterized protein n=1 Tax=Gossypium barbadense TaxID=3634 RepID=A0A2P5Y1M3_GOSBA|nr:hypothetical protein GOBAR_AA11172 [Gossypium barbadense]